MKRTKTIIAGISRTLLGLVFILSGAVKAIDPFGTVYKIEDYLKAFGGFFTDMMALADVAAVGLILLELLLGVCMVLNIRTQWTSWMTLVFYCVMTPLTLYIALTNPVSDCGCFGDAIVLTNWQTFWKNVVLITLAIVLVVLRKSVYPLWRGYMELAIAAVTLLLSFGLMEYTYLHLPLVDFRPYKIGNHLPTIMEDSEPDEYEYLYICEKDSVQQTFTQDNYPDSTWTFVRYESKLIKKGYESPIHDLEIKNADFEDITWNILESEDPVTLVIMYELAKADTTLMPKVEALYENVSATYSMPLDTIQCDTIAMDSISYDIAPMTTTNFYIITGSNSDEIGKFCEKYPTLSQCFCSCDPVTLKTIVRANPGVVVIQNGTVIDKYNLKTK